MPWTLLVFTLVFLTACLVGIGATVHRWRRTRSLPVTAALVAGRALPERVCADPANLLRASGKLQADRLAGRLPAAAYRAAMEHIARLDEAQRPVTMPRDPGSRR